jgi:hypothetical protein
VLILLYFVLNLVYSLEKEGRNKEDTGQLKSWLISSSGVLSHKTVAQPIKRAGVLEVEQCIGGGSSHL